MPGAFSFSLRPSNEAGPAETVPTPSSASSPSAFGTSSSAFANSTSGPSVDSSVQQVAYKSSFSKELGFSEIHFAKSGRSKCWKCMQVIPQSQVRLSYYPSRIKPPAWIHAGCVVPLAVENGTQQSTVQRLRHIKDAGLSDERLAQGLDALIQELSLAV